MSAGGTAGFPATAPSGPDGRLVPILCIGLSAFQIIVTYARPLNPLLHYAIFVSAVSTLIFLTGPVDPSAAPGLTRLRREVTWTWAAASVMAGAYFIARFPSTTMRWPLVDELSALDLACGVIFLAAAFEARRRRASSRLRKAFGRRSAHQKKLRLQQWDSLYYQRPDVL